MKLLTFSAFIFMFISHASLLKADNVGNQYSKTLRIDMEISGEDSMCKVQIVNIKKFDGFNGKAAIAPRELGEFIFTVTDCNTGKIACKDGFSTLYSEWAKMDFQGRYQQTFQHTTLVPCGDGKMHFVLQKREAKSGFKTVADTIIDTKNVEYQQETKGNVNNIHISGDTQNCVDVLILAEGFTSYQENRFDAAARKFCERLMNMSPYNEYKDKINCRSVFIASRDEGWMISSRKEGRSTVLSSHYDTFASQRYLETFETFAVMDYVGSTPADMIVILVDSEEYGGGGVFNEFAIGSINNRSWIPMMIHEVGHSFSGLGDEYFYPNETATDSYDLTVEPWEYNLTTMVDFGTKWEALYKDGKAWLIEGAGYSAKGMYKAFPKCLMLELSSGFCEVCKIAIRERIEYMTE